MVLMPFVLACMGTRGPAPQQEAASITAVVTLAAPQTAEPMATPEAVIPALSRALADKGLTLSPTPVSTDQLHRLGTRTHRIQALVDAASGELSLLIEVTARPRAELGGRYPWQVDATFTVAGSAAAPLVDHQRIAVSLGHIHEGEAAALTAAMNRITKRGAVLADRYRRDGQ